MGRALCSYHNNEMDAAGPVLEHFEVAKEWRGRGIGDCLFRAVKAHYAVVFSGWYNVRVRTCHNTNAPGVVVVQCLALKNNGQKCSITFPARSRKSECNAQTLRCGIRYCLSHWRFNDYDSNELASLVMSN